MLLITGSANRDERKFPDPDRFDIHRKFDHHLAFGYGIHFCLGSHLARLEGRVALEEVLKRFPTWDVDWDAPSGRTPRRSEDGNPFPSWSRERRSSRVPRAPPATPCRRASAQAMTSSARESTGAATAADVKGWIDENWDHGLTVREWWRLLADAGLAHPTWPVGLGGSGATPREARMVLDVLADRNALGPPIGHVAATLAAPTLLEHGTPAQSHDLILAIARGDSSWCQLFSEPGSGSDLASIGTTAVRDGDEWVINGQKVWNSAADTSDLGMLLARTDFDAPKHRGVTYFAIDMNQPGVDVRPLRVMNGSSPFCEVFLTDARAPADRAIGMVNGGWVVAQTTLRYERGSVAGGGVPGLISAQSGSKRRSRSSSRGRDRALRTTSEGSTQPDPVRRCGRPFDDRARSGLRPAERPGCPTRTGALLHPGQGQRLDHAPHRCRRSSQRRRRVDGEADNVAHLSGFPRAQLSNRRRIDVARGTGVATGWRVAVGQPGESWHKDRRRHRRDPTDCARGACSWPTKRAGR